jgi:hypothetical protein
MNAYALAFIAQAQQSAVFDMDLGDVKNTGHGECLSCSL